MFVFNNPMPPKLALPAPEDHEGRLSCVELSAESVLTLPFWDCTAATLFQEMQQMCAVRCTHLLLTCIRRLLTLMRGELKQNVSPVQACARSIYSQKASALPLPHTSCTELITSAPAPAPAHYRGAACLEPALATTVWDSLPSQARRLLHSLRQRDDVLPALPHLPNAAQSLTGRSPHAGTR